MQMERLKLRKRLRHKKLPEIKNEILKYKLFFLNVKESKKLIDKNNFLNTYISFRLARNVLCAGRRKKHQNSQEKISHCLSRVEDDKVKK